MTRIAITSCCKIQMVREQIGWSQIEAAEPDLLLLLGDTAYMHNSRWDHDGLDRRYCEQFEEPHFASLVENVPFLATWDDHDFGTNDSAGGEIADWKRRKSRKLFDKHIWADRLRHRIRKPCSAGIYYSIDFNDIRVIMVDVRYFRTGSRPATQRCLVTSRNNGCVMSWTMTSGTQLSVPVPASRMAQIGKRLATIDASSMSLKHGLPVETEFYSPVGIFIETSSEMTVTTLKSFHRVLVGQRCTGDTRINGREIRSITGRSLTLGGRASRSNCTVDSRQIAVNGEYEVEDGDLISRCACKFCQGYVGAGPQGS